MHQYVLETDRLILRPLTALDAEAVFVWGSDPKVNRYMMYPLYTEVEKVYQWLEHVRQEENEYTFGIVCKADGVLIGSVGMSLNEEGTHWNVGYNLRSDYWGKGYATEATRCLIAFAHRELGIRAFAAEHAVGNPASGKVLRKCGMKFTHPGTYSRFDGSETFQSECYELYLE